MRQMSQRPEKNRFSHMKSLTDVFAISMAVKWADKMAKGR
jgi:hypothetical protein